MEDIQKGLSKPLQEMMISSGDEDAGYNTSSSSYGSNHHNRNESNGSMYFASSFGHHPGRHSANERGLDDFGDEDDSDEDEDDDEDLK